MGRITALNLDQFIRLARTCNVLVYTRSGNNFSVFAMPLDCTISVTAAELDRLRAEFPSLEEVSSVLL